MHLKLALSISLMTAASVCAQPAEPTYWQDVRPIFRKYCTVCHSSKNLKETDVSGGLALDTFELTKKGSARPVLVPGKGGESLLHQLLVTKDEKKRMPLDGKPLPAETIEVVRRWIDTGAKEGKPTEDVPEPKIGAKPPTTRKLDIVINTQATPPAGLLGKGATGKLDLVLKVGPLSPLTAVAFSPDKKLLAAGSYGQVAVWDL